MTYSYHFRKKVLTTRKREGLTIEQTAKRFNIGLASITRWLKHPQPKTKRSRRWSKIDKKQLQLDILKYPDAYHHERAQRLGVSSTGVRDAMKRLGVSYKKNFISSSSRRRQTAILPKKD